MIGAGKFITKTILRRLFNSRGDIMEKEFGRFDRKAGGSAIDWIATAGIKIDILSWLLFASL